MYMFRCIKSCEGDDGRLFAEGDIVRFSSIDFNHVPKMVLACYDGDEWVSLSNFKAITENDVKKWFRFYNRCSEAYKESVD